MCWILVFFLVCASFSAGFTAGILACDVTIDQSPLLVAGKASFHKLFYPQQHQLADKAVAAGMHLAHDVSATLLQRLIVGALR